MSTDLGITSVIANVLRADTISVPASGFVVADPILFAGGASSVPVWAYTCLKDIWGFQDKTDEQWSKLVVDLFGTARSGGSTIDVTSYRVLDQADGPKGVYPSSNVTGAKFSEIHILLKQPDAVQEVNSSRLFYAAQRINRLLDYNYRVNTVHQRQFESTVPSVSAQDDLKVYWIGEVRNDDIKSWLMQFYAFYTLVYV